MNQVNTVLLGTFTNKNIFISNNLHIIGRLQALILALSIGITWARWIIPYRNCADVYDINVDVSIGT